MKTRFVRFAAILVLFSGVASSSALSQESQSDGLGSSSGSSAPQAEANAAIDVLERQASRHFGGDGSERTFLVNRRAGLRAIIDDDGTWSLRDRVDEDRFPEAVITVEGFSPTEAPVLAGEVVSLIDAASLTQMWMNTDRGVQHLFIAYDDALAVDGELVIRLHVAGLTPQLMSGLDAAFVEDGTPRIDYKGLYAFDADHQQLTAWMDASGDVLELHIDVAEAQWPVTIDPIAQSSSTPLVGDGTVEEFGYSLATGFFNTDAFPDLVVGARADGVGNLEGSIRVYFGTATGIPSAATYLRAGADTFRNSGEAVAAGKINNLSDGDDIVVADVGTTGTVAIPPGLSLYRWVNATNSHETVPARLEIPAMATACSLGRFGDLALGDVNGDGRKDVLTRCGDDGAPTEKGRLVVFLGAENIPSTGHPFHFNQNLGLIGDGVASMRLSPSDPFDDVIVPATGFVRIFRGSASGISAADSFDVTIAGSTGRLRADGVDVNGDGFDDLVVGEPFANTSTGRVRVFLNNQAGGFNTITVLDQVGTATNRFFGTVVTGADLNKDNKEEVVACESTTTSTVGLCKVFSGSPTGVETPPRLTVSTFGGEANTNSRNEITFVASADGDGARDLFVGNNDFTANQGRVLIFDGDPARIRPSPDYGTLTSSPLQRNARVGTSLTTIDINGDGRADIVAGAPDFDNGAATDSGAVFGWLTGVTSIDATPDWSAFGGTLDKCGTALAGGSFRGTTIPPQLAIGCPGATTSGGPTAAGNVRLYTMSFSGIPDSTNDGIISAPDAMSGARFGAALANAKDLMNTNADGLVVGAPGHNGFGKVYNIGSGGGTGLLINSLLSDISGSSSSINCQGFGSSVAVPGQLDLSRRVQRPVDNRPTVHRTRYRLGALRRGDRRRTRFQSRWQHRHDRRRSRLLQQLERRRRKGVRLRR